MSEERIRGILVAGVGNAWLRDDGFGGEVARRLAQRELPEGVSVMDAGTGGLDLAYEVMRGYDALVILDISPQGGEPGTLYVIEPDEDSIKGAIDDGEAINPHAHGPADRAALRQVDRSVARPGRRDRVRAGRRRRRRLGSLRSGEGGRRPRGRARPRDDRRAARATPPTRAE